MAPEISVSYKCLNYAVIKASGPDVLNSIGTHIPHEIQAHLSDQFSLLTKQQRLVAQVVYYVISKFSNESVDCRGYREGSINKYDFTSHALDQT